MRIDSAVAEAGFGVLERQSGEEAAPVVVPLDLSDKGLLAYYAQIDNPATMQHMLSLDDADEWAFDYAGFADAHPDPETSALIRACESTCRLLAGLSDEAPLAHDLLAETVRVLGHVTTSRSINIINYLGQQFPTFVRRVAAYGRDVIDGALAADEDLLACAHTIAERLSAMRNAEVLSDMFSAERLEAIAVLLNTKPTERLK